MHAVLHAITEFPQSMKQLSPIVYAALVALLCFACGGLGYGLHYKQNILDTHLFVAVVVCFACIPVTWLATILRNSEHEWIPLKRLMGRACRKWPQLSRHIIHAQLLACVRELLRLQPFPNPARKRLPIHRRRAARRRCHILCRGIV